MEFTLKAFRKRRVWVCVCGRVGVWWVGGRGGCVFWGGGGGVLHSAYSILESHALGDKARILMLM